MSDPGETVEAVDELTDRERAILEIAGRDYRHNGSREKAARDELGLNATRYGQLLNVIIDKPAARIAEPVLVKRLLRLRDTRRARRTANRTLAQTR